MKLKDLNTPGVYFTTEPYGIPSYSQTWFRRDYDSKSGLYTCTRFDDDSKLCHLSGDTDVYVDFILPLPRK